LASGYTEVAATQWGVDKKLTALLAVLLALPSCLPPQHGAFAVLPGSPNYLLRSPDRRTTPFPDVLRAYNGFERGQNGIDLRPLMALEIENAYYKKGMPARELNGFLGTETAHYEVTIHGLRLSSVHSMKQRPEGALPVQDLISPAQRKFRYYRLYFEIMFPNGNTHGSVLLGANSKEELDRLSGELDHPEAVCNGTSTHCTVFPEACSVSVEMQIVVNGKAEAVIWGTLLQNAIAEHPRHVTLKRLYTGRLVPVEINAQDPNALRLPLLPGDHVTWN
jgi:hypothetical protein